jgi:hypothetical protein
MALHGQAGWIIRLAVIGTNAYFCYHDARNGDEVSAALGRVAGGGSAKIARECGFGSGTPGSAAEARTPAYLPKPTIFRQPRFPAWTSTR